MVEWHMHYKPRLSELLGVYQANYVQAAAQQAARPGLRRAVDMAHGPLRVRSDGYLGQFSGRAWLPQQVPESFEGAAALRR
jgi:hypothetical protein